MMSLHRGSLVVALLAALLSGGMALADDAAIASQAEPATQTESSTQAATTASVAAPAPAAAPVSATIPAGSRPVVGTSASNMVSGLLFLLVLVLGAAWLIKRVGGMPAMRTNSSMKVVAALSLGPRERVVLIELGGQQWLLGVSGGSINTLHHFEQPIVAGGGDDFAGKLRQLWPQGVGK